MLLMKCIFCQQEKKNDNSLRNHERLCKLNPNRQQTYMENWTEEKRRAQSETMKLNNSNKQRIFTIEMKKKLSEKQKLFNNKYWTEEQKQSHSKTMQKVVLNNQESYTGKNIRGSRVKTYQGIDYYGNKCSFRGKWELLVSELLTKENIAWEKDKLVGKYLWNGKEHLYFADFYLTEQKKYIEVKGYETDRDKAKYSICKELILIKQQKITLLTEGKISIQSLI